MSDKTRDILERYTLECVFKTTRNEPLTEGLTENQIMVWLHEESGVETRLLKSIVQKDVKQNMIRVAFESPCNCFQAMFQVRQQIDRIRNRRGVTRLAYYIDVRCLEWSLVQAMTYPLHDKFWPIYPKFDKDFQSKLSQHCQILRLEWVEFPSSREKLNIAKLYILVKGNTIELSNLKIFGLKFHIVDDRVYRRGKEYIRQLFDCAPAPFPLCSPRPVLDEDELNINNETEQGSPKRRRNASLFSENGNCSFKPDEPPPRQERGRSPSLNSPPSVRVTFKPDDSFRLAKRRNAAIQDRDESRDFSPSTSHTSFKTNISLRLAKRRNTSVQDADDSSSFTPASPNRGTIKRRNATDGNENIDFIPLGSKTDDKSRADTVKIADKETRERSQDL